MTEPVMPSLPPRLDYASSQLRPLKPWGKGFLAVCATFVFWGLGHWLAGRTRRGWVWFAAWFAVKGAAIAAFGIARLTPSLLVLMPLEIICVIGVLIDAFFCGRASERRMFASPLLRYLGGIGLLVIAGAFSKAVAIPLRAHVGDTCVAASHSMQPTLNPGDQFVASKLPFEPRRWDVVVFQAPEGPDQSRHQLWVMRVAGLPGETVEIIAGRVCISGLPVPSPAGIGPYQGIMQTSSRAGNGCDGQPITLGPGEYYILGDDPPIAGDSRYWSALPGHPPGALPRESIVGRVTAVYWPLQRARMLP